MYCMEVPGRMEDQVPFAKPFDCSGGHRLPKLIPMFTLARSSVPSTRFAEPEH